MQTIPGLPSKAGEEGTGRVRLATLDTSLTFESLKGRVSFVPKKNLTSYGSSCELQ